jgi:hypothetical protein
MNKDTLDSVASLKQKINLKELWGNYKSNYGLLIVFIFFALLDYFFNGFATFLMLMIFGIPSALLLLIPLLTKLILPITFNIILLIAVLIGMAIKLLEIFNVNNWGKH